MIGIRIEKIRLELREFARLAKSQDTDMLACLIKVSVIVAEVISAGRPHVGSLPKESARLH
jgi:hypothetical protein